MYRDLLEEIIKRAHSVEPQGDGIMMVLIRLDEIVAAAKAAKRRERARLLPKRRKSKYVPPHASAHQPKA